MTVSWNGKVYRVCLDTSGRIVVITSTGPRSSRVAEAGVGDAVLAGFYVFPVGEKVG